MMNYYATSMMGSGYGILMILFWVLVFVGVMLLVIWGIRAVGASSAAPMAPPKDSACEIARARYAKGEITKEQCDEICKNLRI